MKGLTHEKCKGCAFMGIKYLVTVCNRYRNPSLFARIRIVDGVKTCFYFACPSSQLGHSLYGDEIAEKNKQYDRKRVGQQKQRRSR